MATYCNYPASNGSCGREIADGREHCYLHGDGGGTPPGHGAPAGNDNAVGNSGGGAPVHNTNAATHAGYSAPQKHYERLRDNQPPTAKEPVYGGVELAWELVSTFVDDLIEEYALVHDIPPENVRDDERVMTKIREIAAMRDQKQRARDRPPVYAKEKEIERPDGSTMMTTVTARPPGWEAGFRLYSKIERKKKRLGIDGQAVREAKDRRKRFKEVGY